MATDINSVVLIGRLTRDAELRYSNSGTAICKFSIANNYSRKTGDTWGEETNFFDAVLMGRRAEALQKYLVKGKQIGIKGELRQDRWEQDGQRRSRVEIWVNDVNLLGGGQGGGGGGGGDTNRGAPSPSQGYGQSNGGNDFGSGSDFEDDVPF
ncbi:MAG: single-stranded DNA-binding protein [Spirochaetota bacterium]